MTNTRLYWHLIKFHVLSVPRYLWIVVIGLVVFLGGVFSLVGGATTLNSGENIFSLVYFFILGVQASWGMQSCAVRNSGQIWATGSNDFLRTRAVDRSILFWSKLTVYFAICSLVWITLAVPQLLQNKPVQVKLYGDPHDRQTESVLTSTPAFDAKVVSKDGKGRVTIDLGKGAQVMAGLTGAKVALITLLTLWFFVALRWPTRWLLVVFFTFLAAWLLLMFGSLWLKGSWLDALGYRQQIVFYARHPLAIWMPILILGGFAIWQSRRRYLRP